MIVNTFIADSVHYWTITPKKVMVISKYHVFVFSADPVHNVVTEAPGPVTSKS